MGNLKPGTVTDDARPELSGKGKPGSTVTIMDGDDVLGSTVGGSGRQLDLHS
ncbi:Uncharacterised protein [Enterobacter cloacae]|uniref:Uncharacterized protein n=1 Tax=Enterobacter cloacae TaxID=550 RepID=A0A377M7L6_ENTCL|nr:Uncharacterised protein [Enterobacter cloacae]